MDIDTPVDIFLGSLSINSSRLLVHLQTSLAGETHYMV